MDKQILYMVSHKDASKETDHRHYLYNSEEEAKLNCVELNEWYGEETQEVHEVEITKLRKVDVSRL